MPEEDKKNNPVIRISITSVVGTGQQQMTLETYADAASETKFLDAMTDKLFWVVNRQAKLAEIEGMKKLLESEENQLAAMLADLERENARQEKLKIGADGKRVPYKLPPKDQQALENIKVNIHERKRRNAKLKEDINVRVAEWGAPKS